MKKAKIIILFLLVLGLIGLLTLKPQSQLPPQTTGETVPPKIYSHAEIETYISKMTLEEKVGQMMIVSVSGSDIDYYAKRMIDLRNIGGVILMGENIKNPEQVQSFLKNLQAETKNNSTHIPLFTSIDQEGGLVTRIKFDYIKNTDPQSKLDADTSSSVAKTRGEELKALGFTMVLAPVADYSTDKDSFIYDRTFQKDAATTTTYTRNMVQAYLQTNLIPVVKHYPGHGNSKNDPHTQAVTIEKTEYDTQFDIFKDILKDNGAPVIMTGHITVKDDDGKPASLSSSIIKKLRDDAKFDGIIMTDDLKMLTSYSTTDIGELGVQAIKAGNDMVLAINIPEDQVKIYEALIKAVNDKTISTEQIDKSVYRILKTKCQYMYCDLFK